jgi:hypothetical protein
VQTNILSILLLQLQLQLAAMGCGHPIPKEVQLIIVQMSHIFHKEDISVYTGTPLWSVKWILSYFHQHGTIKPLNDECK